MTEKVLGLTEALPLKFEAPKPLDQGQVLVNFAREIGQLEKNNLTITAAHDLLPYVSENFPGAEKVVGNLESLAYLTLESTDPNADPLIHDRKAVLIKTKDGTTATIAVALYDRTEAGWHFGGAGNYIIEDQPTSLLGYSMLHSEDLAKKMRFKAWENGLAADLAGSKTIITTTAWKEDKTLQVVTGMMFSPNGIWPNVITGSDVGQDEFTIALMEKGSRLGGGIGQIVGTEYGLPGTAGYARISMQEVYKAMGEKFNITPLSMSTVLVEGFGKIGFTTTEMLIDNQAQKIIVTDPALFPDLVASLGIKESDAQAIAQNWQQLQQKASEIGVELVKIRPEELENQQANLYCPCSSQEHIITKTRIDRLAQNGVKVILSGANNAFADNQLATYAEKTYQVFTPPPGLANGGSATSAAFETNFLQQRSQGLWQDEPGKPGYQQFVEQVLVPHIAKNAREKMAILSRIWKEQKNQGVSLFEAGNIAFEQWRKGQS